MMYVWRCEGCGTEISSNAQTEPDILARWDKVLKDCREQAVRQVLEM